MTVRCLVGFYGLNRSLRSTASSVATKITKPLRAAKADLHFVAHFNEPQLINSEHSKEFNVRVTRDGLARLTLDAVMIEEQEERRLPKSVIDAIDRLPPGYRVEPRQTMI